MDKSDVEYKEIKTALHVGRPPIYPDRKRTTWEMSPELLAEIDKRRGSDSRAIHVEQELRKFYGMSPLTPLKPQ